MYGDLEALVRIIEFVNPYFAENNWSWVPRDDYVDQPEMNLLGRQLTAAFQIRLATILEQLVHGFVTAVSLHHSQFFPKGVDLFHAQEDYRHWTQRRHDYLLQFHQW